VLFVSVGVILLIFFLGKDPFIITEIVLMIVLLLIDLICIALHAAI